MNVGGTKARVTASHVIIDWRRGALPMKRPFEGEEPNCQVSSLGLEAGASVPVVLGSGLVRQDSGSIMGGDANEPLRASVMGFIDYEDASRTRRRTAFCRTFDRGANRFVRTDNEDYEHEE